MTPENRPDDELFTALLARYEEALNTGRDTDPAHDPAVPAGLLPRLQSALDGLRRLRDGWARPEDATTPRADTGDSPTEGESVPAHALTAEQVGRFRILRPLGGGGGGMVFLAFDPTLRREVALKVPRPEALLTPELRRRFLREGRAAAALDHPNLVPLFEAGEVNGLGYIVSAYCPGSDLAAWLARRTEPVPVRTAATLAAALAGALHYVHGRGIFHRDVKPSNVLLDPGGPQAAELGFTPRLTDFGLARLPDGQTEATRSGTVFGTVSYMAPEQIQGQPADVGPHTDVYGLGALLYEVLTSRPPFRGATAADTLRQALDDEPARPRSLRADLPRDLETICLKCLQKEPRRRYASAGDLADDLGRFLRGEPIRARPAGRLERAWRWCRRNPAPAGLAVLSAVAAGLLLALGFWYSSRIGAARGEAAAAEERAAAAEALAQTRGYFGLLGQVRERALYRRPGWTQAGADDLIRAATLPLARDALPELRTALAECLGGKDIRRTARAVEDCSGHALAYDPRRRWLAVGEQKAQGWAVCRVLLADPQTGRPVRSLPFPPSLPFQVHSRVQDGSRVLAFSPDGRWLIAGARSGRLHRWDLNAEPPGLDSWQGHDKEVRALCFSPDGAVLFSAADDRALRRWDATGWGKTAEAAMEIGNGGLTISPGGEWLACADGGQLRLLDPATLRPAGPDVPGPAHALCASPDGCTLAVAAADTIRLVDVRAGQGVRTLRAGGGETSHNGDVTDLHFSSDGALLASLSRPANEVHLWDTAGGRLLTAWGAGDGAGRLAFRPDGRGLAVLANRHTALYEIVGLDIQTAAILGPGAVYGFAFHPGGRALACLTGSRRAEIPVWELIWRPLTGEPPRGTVLRVLQPGSPCGPAFRRDGRLLAFPHGGTCLWRWDLVTGRAERADPALRLADLQFAPNGQLWAISAGDAHSWESCGSRPPTCWSNRLSGALTGLGALTTLAAGRRWVVAGGQDGIANLLRADGAVYQASFRCASCRLTAAALNPSETLAAVGSEQGEVCLLEVPSGQLLARLEGHAEAVATLAFAGNALLASGSRDRTVRLNAWDGRAARPLLALRLGGPVQRVAFAPDNRRLGVLVRGERAVRLWQLDRLWPLLDALSPADPLPHLPPPATPAEPLPPVPPPAIEEAPRGPHGLRAALFDGPEFDRHVVTRYDLPPQGDWALDAPDPRLPADWFSIRWTGWLNAPRAGRYTFHLRADDGVRLWLDGRLLIDTWKASDRSQVHEAATNLSAGPHALRLDYFEAQAAACISLRWTPPGGKSEPVPAAALFHNRADAGK